MRLSQFVEKIVNMQLKARVRKLHDYMVLHQQIHLLRSDDPRCLTLGSVIHPHPSGISQLPRNKADSQNHQSLFNWLNDTLGKEKNSKAPAAKVLEARSTDWLTRVPADLATSSRIERQASSWQHPLLLYTVTKLPNKWTWLTNTALEHHTSWIRFFDVIPMNYDLISI